MKYFFAIFCLLISFVTAAQGNVILEGYYITGFHDSFVELKNNLPDRHVGAPKDRKDYTLTNYINKNKCSRSASRGIYVKAKGRKYDFKHISERDIYCDYRFEITEIVAVDTTLTLWDSYLAQAEKGKKVELPLIEIKRFPDNFKKGEAYIYNGKNNDYDVKLALKKRSVGKLEYTITINDKTGKSWVQSGGLTLNVLTYGLFLKGIEPEYSYLNDPVAETFGFSISSDSDTITTLGLKLFDVNGNENEQWLILTRMR